jgi:hypothetical protein
VLQLFNFFEGTGLMSGNSKPLGFNKGPLSVSPQMLDKTEPYLNLLLSAKESDPEALETINRLARELDENPSLAEIFLKKVMTRGGDLFPWFLPDLSQRIHSKPVQKGIKRALYLFKQKGIEPPSTTAQQKKQEAGILREIEPAQGTGYLSEFDGLKNQMVGLLIPKSAKERLFVFALIGIEGLESLQSLEISKREVKDIIADLERRSGLVFLEADLTHAAFVLKESHDRNSQLSKDDEWAYQGIIKLLEGKKLIGQSPIILSLLTPEPLKKSISPDLKMLARTPEIFYLLPEPKILDPYLRTVEEAKTGLLILNEMQKRERIKAVLDQAVRELFPLEKRSIPRRYLEEAAYLYYLKGKREEAADLLFWAGTMDQEQGSSSEKDSPLLVWLMETALLRKDAGTVSANEPSEQTTEGGIILPAWVRREDSR